MDLTIEFKDLNSTDEVADEGDGSGSRPSADGSVREKWDGTEVVDSFCSLPGPSGWRMSKGEAASSSQLDEFIPHYKAPSSDLSMGSIPTGKGVEEFIQRGSCGAIFESVLSLAWPTAVTQNFISMPYPYPPSVFPIVATLIHSGILTESPTVIERVVLRFCELLKTAPLSPICTNEKRFISFMMIFILVRALQDQYRFSPESVMFFQSRLKPLVNDALIKFGRPLIGRAETLLNRFATAQFDVEGLLGDFGKCFQDIKNSLTLPPVIKNFIIQNIMAMIDARIVNKVLANPARLTFSNSSTWRSLITALETSTGHLLRMMSEVTSVLVLGPKICGHPPICDEVSPHLSKELVLFLLTNFKHDEMMNENIDASQFVSHYGVCPSHEFCQPDNPIIAPILQDDYMTLAGAVRISDWNACEIHADLLEQFPHLKDYLHSSLSHE
jgi:hypothetical protein